MIGQTVQSNIFNALKIYSLSLDFDVTSKTQISVGRKINPKIASIGAIDGLEAETKAGNFTFGAVAGTSPDYMDYSFNPKQFEYGGYLSHEIKNKIGQYVNIVGSFSTDQAMVEPTDVLYTFSTTIH